MRENLTFDGQKEMNERPSPKWILKDSGKKVYIPDGELRFMPLQRFCLQFIPREDLIKNGHTLMLRENLVRLGESYLERCDEMFQELYKTYGISLPEYKFGIEESKSRELVFYAKAEEIFGENLGKLIKDLDGKQGIVKQIEQLYASLTRYLRDKVSQENYYLTDIFYLRQFVYGKAPGDEEPKLYLVDIDPIAKKTNLEIDNVPIFLMSLRQLVAEMISIENKAGKQFSEAREQISLLLQGVSDGRRSVRREVEIINSKLG